MDNGILYDYLYCLIKKSNNGFLIRRVYLNDIIKDYCQGYKILPELDFKGYYPKAYIHSPARNVLIPEDVNVDNFNTWETTGMNYMRSEVPKELSEIEINIIKSRLKDIPKEIILDSLRTDVINLAYKNPLDMGVIKPLTKPIERYGKVLKDGSHGNLPFHIKALIKSKMETIVGDKFCVIPIKTNEMEGKKVIRRKRIYIAFDMDKGFPEDYEIDFEYYLRSNLWGKINSIFDLTPKELESIILTDDIKKVLNIDYNKEIKNKLNGGMNV
jgi:hypothetical protein